MDGFEWGFDPIFIPDHKVNPNRLTFAIMDTKVKNQISHRAVALNKLAEYLKTVETTI